MTLTKPPNVADDAVLSKKWDELCVGRNFKQSQAQTLALLCQWYAIIERCTQDLADAGGQVAYSTQTGDIKALPQLAIMKQASAEIRQLQSDLGLNEPAQEKKERKATTLEVITRRRRQPATDIRSGAKMA